ncbi:MAG TPA: CHAP domain-containing protein [Candidatus Saccharimonadales bacterium]|nr:CHAP domain-containing protein [Candidatus Saccharimonadales bacterium]
MPKQNTEKFKFIINHARLPIMMLALAGLISVGAVVHADQFDDQINALKAQNSETQGVLNGLESQAGSYQNAIDQLQAQINGLQDQIAANESEQAALQQKITDAQNKIDQEKKFLGEDLKTMYIDGQLSTIEELATSKNLSDYVDREEYRTTVQNKIDDLIKQIADLQAQLQKQKAELDEMVANEKQQNAQLGGAQSQQQNLLAYNEGQQAAYNSQINSNSGKIADLRRQQIAANARFIGGAAGSGPACGGGYPARWCDIPQDSVIDSWGMYNRECVSYTAFKVAASGRYMPYWGGVGNANQWPGDARAAGIPVDTNPQPGDVAISMRGAFGHAMYVEAVSGGTISISQYNAALDGRYSTNVVSSSGLYFIHF